MFAQQNQDPLRPNGILRGSLSCVFKKLQLFHPLPQMAAERVIQQEVNTFIIKDEEIFIRGKCRMTLMAFKAFSVRSTEDRLGGGHQEH